MENNKTRDNLDSYSHLLWFARGLYMPTAILLNGQLFNGGLKILLFNAYMSKYFGLPSLFSIGLPSLFSIICIKKLSIASFQAQRNTKIKHNYSRYQFHACLFRSCTLFQTVVTIVMRISMFPLEGHSGGISGYFRK